MRDNRAYRKEAEALVAQMTLEEKASQLTYNSPAIPRLGIPAYNWWNEALHGVARAGTATSFPQAIGLAAMFDEAFLERIADAIATEGRAKFNESSRHGDRDIYKGLTFWSPNVNIFRDPRWGRGHETYGEDPFLSGRLGVAYIKGLQGDGEVMKSAACAKHFAVHSGPEDERHSFNAVVSRKDLWETYLPAFETCVKEGQVEAVMGAYNRTNGEPCCGSHTLLRDILREAWGFQGHVVSDCWALKDFHMHHGVTATPIQSAALAIDAGCDLNCGNIYLVMLQALEAGLITEGHITRAAERLLATRLKLGLFKETEFDRIPYEAVESPEHVEMAVEAARKACVLLKNEGVLPIHRERVHTIGVVGPNANSRLALKGNYYGTSSRYITLLEGIQDEAGADIRVLYAKGCELAKDRTEPLALPHDRLMEAVTVAEHSDLVVLCLGLDETIEGEELDEGNNCGSGDKADLQLPQVQRQLLDRILATGKPVVVCLVAGSAIDLQVAQEKADAVLLAWYPGARGGKAVADLLFGNASPSGKLPVTFYSTLEDLPDFKDYSMRNRTYRHLEQKPLYPFGYGLTYGDVRCTGAVLLEEAKAGRPATIRVTVRNQGSTATEEVVQAYLENRESVHAVRNTSLCAFSRVRLAPGEEQELLLEIPWDSFLVVDDRGEKILDGRTCRVYLGVVGPDERSRELTGKEPLVLELAVPRE
ncbi:glycoside hydrolase family 3 C-terminal domain-containing protein [Anaerotalea alkaliphila]|uniref:Glycoside hydrolase family 3 protein n=1 Tax=Anaerotalea alkaliphila TaxID=2662126 RepID=A0A7X5KP33_9FIRM|nr:glycoside hydrolase family 3 C-terminal domain-containing protein [Anaerotalea alkaliphila]NDL68579.1 glycoside hydrolase family 3 protein [Anaerotalea alkaliphila]